MCNCYNILTVVRHQQQINRKVRIQYGVSRNMNAFPDGLEQDMRPLMPFWTHSSGNKVTYVIMCHNTCNSLWGFGWIAHNTSYLTNIITAEYKYKFSNSRKLFHRNLSSRPLYARFITLAVKKETTKEICIKVRFSWKSTFLDTTGNNIPSVVFNNRFTNFQH